MFICSASFHTTPESSRIPLARMMMRLIVFLSTIAARTSHLGSMGKDDGQSEDLDKGEATAPSINVCARLLKWDCVRKYACINRLRCIYLLGIEFCDPFLLALGCVAHNYKENQSSQPDRNWELPLLLRETLNLHARRGASARPTNPARNLPFKFVLRAAQIARQFIKRQHTNIRIKKTHNQPSLCKLRPILRWICGGEVDFRYAIVLFPSASNIAYILVYTLSGAKRATHTHTLSHLPKCLLPEPLCFALCASAIYME